MPPEAPRPSRAAVMPPALPALLLLVLLALAGCRAEPEPVIEPPLPVAALEAVAETPGVPREALARAIDTLFVGEGLGETRAVLVLHEGEVVAERYGAGYGPDTRFIGWSMSKTVTGVLMGLLVADGRIALDDAPPIPRWQRVGDPRGAITVRHLLQMRSGLRHREKAEPVYESAEVRMLFLDGRDDMAGWAEAQPLEHEPGAQFVYSTPTSTILADVFARVLAPGAGVAERRASADEFLHDRLARPLGMTSLVAEYDRAGTMLGGSMVWASAPDWARFGEFLRHRGAVEGAQIVPRGWIEFMTTPSPHAPDYGAQVWLNHESGTDRQMLFPEAGPDTLFAAIGHQGQYILVSPRQRLTVVRLGQTDNEDRAALVEALSEVVALYPAR